tara:strand:- start:860 stop:2368 length:1509 start_codon:yes stop_codon:yes gene_type:complete
MSYTPSADDDMNNVAKSSGDPMPTPTDIPDLVRIGTIPTNTAISIDTDILDPVVNTDQFCRFQFQNKGILHSHSKITLRFDKQSTRAWAPVNVGIHSVIQRCRLLVGTKTISEIDDFNHYMAYKSAFMSNEHQKQREQVTSGRMIAHKVYYDNGSNVSGAGQSNTSASYIGLDTGMNVSATASGTVVSEQSDLEARPYQVTNSAFGGPEYQIALADLFPFLYSNQLPLYMMTEPVTVELTFAEPTKRRLCTTDGSSSTSFKFDLTATKLVADYQYFPQEIMEQYAQANRDMTFSYVDYRLAKRTVSVNEAAGSEKAIPEQIMNIGAAGRICSKVIALLNQDAEFPTGNMTNLYNSTGAPSDYASISNVRSNGTTTTNIKYNNQFLYPVDIDNPCRHFYQVTQAEGMVPFVTRDEYSDAGGLITNTTFEGGAQAEDLANKFFIQAYHLNRAERINSRGIEYYFQYSKLANLSGGSTDSYTMRTYVELMKMATLRDGVMETFFG